MTHEELKALAKELGVEYHHLLGADKLERLLRDHCEKQLNESFESVASRFGYTVTPSEESSRNNTPLPEGITQEEIDKLSRLTFADVDAKTRKKANDGAFKHAMKLVRCIITCNNKNKSSYQGEIFTVRNARIAEVKKFIPFGVTTHVPSILLNSIRERQYQMFRKEKLPSGNLVTRSFLVPEYNIQILDPITPEEFNAIKRKQLAEGEGNK